MQTTGQCSAGLAHCCVAAGCKRLSHCVQLSCSCLCMPIPQHPTPCLVFVQVVGSALQVLQLCARAAQLIEAKQLYKAYTVLEAIQRDHGALLQGTGGDSATGALPGGAAAWPPGPAASAGSAAASREGTPHKAGILGAPTGAAAGGTPGRAATAHRPGSGGGGRAQLGPLASFLRGRVAELTAVLEQRAIADFHNWLTSVRAQARTIGLRAVRWAAAERQQEEQLARQRKLLLPRLEGAADLRAAGRLVAQSLQAPGVAEAAPPTPLEVPHAVGTPAAPAAPAASPLRGAGAPGADTLGAARTASFRATRQAASSPTRAAAAAAATAAGSPADSPRSAASASRATAAAGGALQTPRPAQARGLTRAETLAMTGVCLCRRRALHRPVVPARCPPEAGYPRYLCQSNGRASGSVEVCELWMVPARLPSLPLQATCWTAWTWRPCIAACTSTPAWAACHGSPSITHRTGGSRWGRLGYKRVQGRGLVKSAAPACEVTGARCGQPGRQELGQGLGPPCSAGGSSCAACGRRSCRVHAGRVSVCLPSFACLRPEVRVISRPSCRLVVACPRVQLATDLTLSGDFLEHYQAYLTQLVRDRAKK